MDVWLLNFAKENMLTIGLALSVLKVIAIETPWAADDKIIAIFTGYFKKGEK